MAPSPESQCIVTKWIEMKNNFGLNNLTKIFFLLLLATGCTFKADVISSGEDGSQTNTFAASVANRHVKVGETTSLILSGGTPPYTVSIESGDGQLENSGETYRASGQGLVQLRASDSSGQSELIDVQNYLAGDLDQFWGLQSGRSHIPDYGGYDFINDMILDSSDRPLILGSATLGENNLAFFITRLNTDFTVDSSFGDNGYVYLDINPSAHDRARSIGLQTDGKIIVAGYSGGEFELARLNTDGSLDTTFGSSGLVTTPVGIGNSELHSMKVLADDRIITVGTGIPVADQDIATVRYLADGSLDTSYGSGGIELTDFSGNDIGYDILVDGSGRYIIAGSVDGNGSSEDFLVARLTTTGGIDVSFNTVGSNVIDVNFDEDVFHSLFFQTGGEIIAGGKSITASGRRFTTARFNADGTLDTSYGASGISTESVSNIDFLYELIPFADDTFLGVGSCWDVGGSNFCLIKYDADGAIDTSFATNGAFYQDLLGAETIFAALRLPDGSFLAGGETSNSTSYDRQRTLLTHFTSNGALNTGLFTSTGYRDDFNLSYADQDVATMALTPNNKILTIATGRSLTNDTFLSQLNLDGSLDTEFGTQGVNNANISDNLEYANALGFQSTGKIIVAGGGWGTGGTNSNIRLSRFNTDGTLDTSFGSESGRQDFDITNNSQDGHAILVLPDDSLIVAGDTNSPGNNDCVMAKYSPDGVLDNSFGTSSGYTITSINANSDRFIDLELLSDGKILAVGGYDATSQLFTSRYLSDGTLDTSYGTSGIETYTIDNHEFLNKIKALNNGKILLSGGTGNNYNDLNPTLIRLNSDGSLDTSFNGTGYAVINIGLTARNEIHDFYLDSEGSVFAIGSAYNGTDFDIIVWKINADGSTDSSFGVNGIKSYDLGGNEEGKAIVIHPTDGSLVIGGSTDINKTQEDPVTLKVLP